MESFRDKCEILKEAEYYTRNDGTWEGLKTTFVDGNFSLDFCFESAPHGDVCGS